MAIQVNERERLVHLQGPNYSQVLQVLPQGYLAHQKLGHQRLPGAGRTQRPNPAPGVACDGGLAE